MTSKTASKEEKIRALAELDGVRCNKGNGWLSKTLNDVVVPNYLTSYDAIIPLIQKQDIETRRDVYRNLHRDKWHDDTETTKRFTVDIGDFISFTAEQLADALLIATGKMTNE